MELSVLGCDGGASRDHRNASFLVDGRLALEAGSLASSLSVDAQAAVEAVLVSHAHLDHVGELGALCDVRAQQGGPPLLVAGLPEVLDALRKHFFNDVLWPDFTRIPSVDAPTLRLLPIAPEHWTVVAGLSVLPVVVDHGVPACGFVVRNASAAFAYSGDTGPTQRFWEVLNDADALAFVVTEVSFPDRLEPLARASGHLTPSLLAAELAKLGRRVPVYLYGLKPVHAAEIAAEIEALGRDDLHVLEGGESLRA